MVCRLYVRLCLMAFTYLLIRYFYIYTFGYTDPITTREIGFAFEDALAFGGAAAPEEALGAFAGTAS